MKLKQILNEFKTISIFDADDTLFRTDSWVYVTHADGHRIKMNPGQYAVYPPRPDDKFDFSEFDKMLRNPQIIKKNATLLKSQLLDASKKTNKKVTILTARKLGFPIKHFFKSIGLEVYVIALGTGDPQAKADWIEKKIKDGYTTIYFTDDSQKNLAAVQSLQKKYPDVTIKTKLA